MGCTTSVPPASEPRDWPECSGDRFTVSYPPGWFVHPGDETNRVGQCELFAAQEFITQPEPDWGWDGAQIVLGVESGCRGLLERVASEEQVEVGGYPGWRRSLEAGEGGPMPKAYEYFVTLISRGSCESDEWFYARTESDDPGDYAENSQALDQMIQTVSFDPPAP